MLFIILASLPSLLVLALAWVRLGRQSQLARLAARERSAILSDAEFADSARRLRRVLESVGR